MISFLPDLNPELLIPVLNYDPVFDFIVFLFGCNSASYMPLRLVFFKHLMHIIVKNTVNLIKPFCYINMHG